MTFPILNRDSDTIRNWSPKLDAGAVPPGSSLMWFTSTAPTGWLLCNGAAVSRTTYADLFAVIGTTYGTGDGSTTFNLPNLKQRFPLGKADSGTGSTLGGTGGTIDHTHTVPAHYHDSRAAGADIRITTSGSHQHGQNVSANPGSGGSGVRADFDTDATGLSSYPQGIATDAATHDHANSYFTGKVGLVTGGVNGDAQMTSGGNNPPFLAVNFIIKT